MALPSQPSNQLVASVGRVIEGVFIIIPFPLFFLKSILPLIVSLQVKAIVLHGEDGKI